MLAARSLSCQCVSRHFRPLTSPPPCCLVPARLLVTTRATQDGKSWAEIAGEAVGVVKDVATKIKDTATSAIESLMSPKQQQQQQQQKPVRRQDQRAAPLYRPEDERQLPQFPTPGGLFGGILGGLVNTAVKGISQEMQRAAAETRDVSDEAVLRIQNSKRLQQRLGRVTAGPPMGQSVSSSNINGRVSKTINLVMPVYDAGGVPVAQAQVTQVSGGSGDVRSSRITVRMPEGDTLTLEDDDGQYGQSGSGSTGQYSGEVVDAEFRDLK